MIEVNYCANTKLLELDPKVPEATGNLPKITIDDSACKELADGRISYSSPVVIRENEIEVFRKLTTVDPKSNEYIFGYPIDTRK